MTDNPFDDSAAPIGDPVTIIAGSYRNWRKALDYDASLFRVIYSLRLAGAVIKKITGSAQSDGTWSFAIVSLTSADWATGDYSYDYIVQRISDNEEFILSSGRVKVTLAAADRRAHAEIMLAKIESILENRADNDVDSYSISGRSISKMPIAELRKWREYYLSEIAEISPGPKRNKVKVMFK